MKYLKLFESDTHDDLFQKIEDAFTHIEDKWENFSIKKHIKGVSNPFIEIEAPLPLLNINKLSEFIMDIETSIKRINADLKYHLSIKNNKSILIRIGNMIGVIISEDEQGEFLDLESINLIGDMFDVLVIDVMRRIGSGQKEIMVIDIDSNSKQKAIDFSNYLVKSSPNIFTKVEDILMDELSGSYQIKLSLARDFEF